jgi:hypothetical protein
MNARLFCAVASLCLLPGVGLAQDGLRSASLPERSPQQPIPAPRVDQFIAAPDTYTNRGENLPRRHRSRHDYPVGLGYGYSPYVSPAPENHDARTELPNGYLHLQMQPGTAQVFVDGYYMGSADDFRRLIPGRSLEAGAHRVELRAQGYETKTFDVLIPPNDTVSYRSNLEATETGVRPVLAPAVPKTFYVIPGCYAGDKPPRAGLPRGCDRSKLRAIPPQPVLSVKR